MRLSRPQVIAPVHALPKLRFEEQRLTSFAGLVIFQALFQRLRLKERLAAVMSATRTVAYKPHNLIMMLVVHLLLGFRRLRERDFYRDDPMVLRVLGLRRLPDVSTWTRGLAEIASQDIDSVRGVNCGLVLDRIRDEGIHRVTADFDGSVLSTRGHAEGSAIGFNRQRKGARSYYPLFCTIAVSVRPAAPGSSRRGVDVAALSVAGRALRWRRQRSPALLPTGTAAGRVGPSAARAA